MGLRITDRPPDQRDISSLFLVGSPRSGTTLLQSLLASHSRIFSIPETHLFDQVLKGSPPLQFPVDGEFGVYLEALKGETGDMATLGAELRTGFPDEASMLACFDNFMTQGVEEQDASVWLEKTPDHIFHIARILGVYPNARFIHLLRHPGRTLPSLYKAKSQWNTDGGSWLNTAGHWLTAFLRAGKYAGMHNHYFLSFEAVLANPEQELVPLFSWLGFDWEAEILTSFQDTAQDLVAGDVAWKQTNLQNTSITETKASGKVPWVFRPLNWLYDYLSPKYLERGQHR